MEFTLTLTSLIYGFSFGLPPRKLPIITLLDADFLDLMLQLDLFEIELHLLLMEVFRDDDLFSASLL